MANDEQYFGYQPVSASEKTKLVREVFHSVAPQYDLMNDLMSLGLHRLWKRFAVRVSGVRSHSRVLDLAGGTGDLTALFARKIMPGIGQLILSDINESMLRLGQDRLIDEGLFHHAQVVQANAECLPFTTEHFDIVSIGFGLRNVTHQETALREMYRVLRVGGRLVILEFSKPVLPGLRSLYDIYSFRLLPWLGKKVVGDEGSYRYLAESIDRHLSQEALLTLMKHVGFEFTRYHQLAGGIVAVHTGIKL